MSVDKTKISKLGFGMMRLPKIDGKMDIERICEMVDIYMKKGFNYFDTAYVYEGGDSEKAVKAAVVDRYPRESFYLADKLPVWEMHSEEDRDKLFNISLERTGAGYFDFYLLHSIEEGANGDNYEKFDCYNWALKKKEEGLIKHFGFSFHGSPEYLISILDKHPEVEFVQIQLNYTDMDNPIIRSRELHKILSERNIPIIVMEPVKGGFLANPMDPVKKIFDDILEGRSYASLALRYAASQEGVFTVLSGMSTEEQVKDNVDLFSDFAELNEAEYKAIDKAVKIIKDVNVIGCTACRYCCTGCPMNIPIPDVFSAVNAMTIYDEEFRPRMYYRGATDKKGKAKDCIKCGQCEAICPQHLQITELLENASMKLDV